MDQEAVDLYAGAHVAQSTSDLAPPSVGPPALEWGMTPATGMYQMAEKAVKNPLAQSSPSQIIRSNDDIARLQSMASLLRDHQLEQIHSHEAWENSTVTAVPLQAQPPILEYENRLGSWPQNPSQTLGASISYQPPTFGITRSGSSAPPRHMHTLAKRKATEAALDQSDDLGPAEHSYGYISQNPSHTPQSSRDGVEDTCINTALDTEAHAEYAVDQKKRRSKRKRKPTNGALPESLTSDSISVPSRQQKSENRNTENRDFSRQAQRKWRDVRVYITLMKVLLKTHLSGGGVTKWGEVTEAVAQYSLEGEEKDQRKVKQTWANEYTRFKSRAAKGRLVTIRTLNSSWPWSLKEKEALWNAAVGACAEKADWEAISKEVSQTAREIGEVEVTAEECNSEWNSVLKYEYMEDQEANSNAVPLQDKIMTSTILPVSDGREHASPSVHNIIPRISSGISNPYNNSHRPVQSTSIDSAFLDPSLERRRVLDEVYDESRPVNLPLQVQPLSISHGRKEHSSGYGADAGFTYEQHRYGRTMPMSPGHGQSNGVYQVDIVEAVGGEDHPGNTLDGEETLIAMESMDAVRLQLERVHRQQYADNALYDGEEHGQEYIEEDEQS